MQQGMSIRNGGKESLGMCTRKAEKQTSQEEEEEEEEGAENTVKSLKESQNFVALGDLFYCSE